MPKSNELIPEILSEVAAHPTTNRRSLIKNLALATAGVGAASALSTTSAHAASTVNPIDVVQFALGLEYLEAEFYTIATTGMTLQQYGVDTSGSGRSGPTLTQYGKVDFSDNTILTEAAVLDIAADERAHVKLLRSALASYSVTPVAKPTINLDVLQARGASLGNMAAFLNLARIFEDIGVSAYSGGSTYLAAAPAVLMIAARILAVEGEHVGNIRLQIAKLGIGTFAVDAADIVPPPTGTNFFSTNTANGLPAYRTPGEVLYLAFGGQANVGSGGFFPMGYNGYFHVSSSPATAANLE